MGEQIANMIIAIVALKACTVVIHDLNETAHSIE